MLMIEWMNLEWGLMAEKALFWPAHRAAIIADVHFGKTAAFRSLGVPVPEATTGRDLARLTTIVEATRCERLIVLGDLIHARDGRASETMRAVAAWRARHRALDVVLVRGNHDIGAGDPPDDWRCRCVGARLEIDGVAMVHDKADSSITTERNGHALISGHVHPCVRLHDAHGPSMRVPCFIFAERSVLLPAFGSFTGAHTVKPSKGDRVFAVGPGHVLEIEPALSAS